MGADVAADARAVARVYALLGEGIAGLLQSLLHAIACMSGCLAIAVLPPETGLAVGCWFLG